jgi:hypothetical protein
VYAIQRLAELAHGDAAFQLRCVPTSFQSRQVRCPSFMPLSALESSAQQPSSPPPLHFTHTHTHPRPTPGSCAALRAFPCATSPLPAPPWM